LSATTPLERSWHGSGSRPRGVFPFRQLRLCAAGLLPGALLLTTGVDAQLYWDINGSTAGAGGPTPTGVWDTTTHNWNNNSGGTTGTGTWSANNVAVFSAGTDATGTFTVTIAAGTTIPGVSGITFEEGAVTIAGGDASSKITLVNPTINAVTGTHTISAVLDGSTTSVSKQGAGTVILSGNNNFGQLDLFAGTVSVSSDANLGLSTGFTRFWGGTLAVTSSFSTSRPFSFDNGSGSFDIVGASTTLSLTSNLYRSLSYNLDKIGAGTLELTQSAFGSGTATINGGTIRLTNGSALGTGQITINTGTLELANVTLSFAPLVLNNGSKLLGTGTASYTNGSPTVGNGAAVTVATGSASDLLTIASYFRSGDSSSVVIFNGPGTVAVTQGTSAATAYQGSFVLSSGILRITDYLALATTGLAQGRPLTLQGGTLDLRSDSAVNYRSNTTVSSNATILSQRQTSGAGQQQTFGTLAINGSTLTVNSGASVTSGTQELIFGNTTLSGNATFNVTNGATAATQLTLSGVSQDVGGRALSKTGSGTLLLTGAGSYTGATIVSGGTLTAAASSGSALGGTSAITVNSGGTLLLGASDQINNSASMTLAGGTFAKGNFSEGSTSSVGVGALTLSTSGSHIDFGTGSVGALTFASFATNGNSLVIDDWTGTANTVGSASTDRLVFDSDQSLNLASFSFTGYAPGATEFSLGGEFYEVVPLTAVPEPATYIGGALALGAIALHQRRRLRSLPRR
jgi:fibronectin-binding autotransporter adhesin